MAKVAFKGQEVSTVGELPQVGQTAKADRLVKSDLKMVGLQDYDGKLKLLNIFPSVDTGVCAASVRKFNQEAAALKNAVVLNISADLPFAHSRFCAAEGIQNVESLSVFRSSMGKDWGLTLAESPLAGLLARSVFVLDQNNKIVYRELVPEIAQEPDYAAALEALKSIS